jgi:hypothetical protein
MEQTTVKDLYDLVQVSQTLIQKMINNNQKGNGKFLNFLFNNRDRAMKLIMPIEAKRPKPDDKVAEYAKKEKELIVEPSQEIKDDEAKLKEYEAGIDKSLEALQLEYKESLEAWEAKIQEFNKEFEKIVEFKPVMLLEENLPDEIGARDMQVLYRYVTEINENKLKKFPIKK